jgi:phenylacetate-CoA oxygenase PaaI subunit
MTEALFVTVAHASLVVPLADNKYLLGRRLSEWTNCAPALEAAVAAAAMTQDELGHARSLYAILSSTPDTPEAYLHEVQRGQLRSAPILEQRFQHWTEFVAAVALFDRAMTLVFEGLHDSKYEPLRQRAAKILQEEWFHRQYGEGWLKRLAAQLNTRGAMQDAVNKFFQPTAEWLAALELDSGTGGVVSKSGKALRERWVNETTALLTRCGLETP